MIKNVKNIIEGSIDLEKFANQDIAIQCDSFELEKFMMKHLDCLGATTINGNEIYDYTYSFGEDILSYWNKFAENGYYLIKKSRTEKYFVDYTKGHTGAVVNISDCIEYIAIETVAEEKSLFTKVIEVLGFVAIFLFAVSLV